MAGFMRRCVWLHWICLTFVACSNAKPVDDGASGAYTDIVFGSDVQFGKKDAATSSGDVGPVDSSPDDSGGLSDSGASDVATGIDATGTTDATPDSALDASSDTVATTGCEFPANPTPGASGASCSGNTDCDSGYCVDSPNGKICSQTCLSCCPTGFHCAQISGSSDSSYVCLAQFIALCRPCNTDAECGAINAGALCVSAGTDGSFCGGACSKDADCPGGYSCQAVQGETGAGQQCVRLSGMCSCSQKSIFDGAATTCAQKNSFGSCSGTRKCALSGLTACSAATPAQ